MSASIEIRAPAEQTEGTRSQILRWLKQVGERVEEDEPLIEIETDKVTVEVASPGAGVLREILRREQEEIAPGELLGVLDPASRTTTEAAAPAPSRAAGAAPSAGEAVATRAATGAGARAAAAEAATPLSPAVRRLLAEHGLSAAAVHGTGERGRLTVEDVLHAAAGSAGGAAARAPAEAGPAPPPAAPAAHGAEPPAYRAARDHGFRGRHERGARGSRTTPR